MNASVDDFYSDDKVFRCSGRGDSLEVRKGPWDRGIVIGLSSWDAPDLSAGLSGAQVQGLRAFLARLDAQSETRWALGWYKTRRHVVDETTKPYGDGSQRAVCSRYTSVYPDGKEYHTHPDAEPIPAANSDAAMAVKACGHCQRIVNQRAQA